MKTIKAWAVVDKDCDILTHWHGPVTFLRTFYFKNYANKQCGIGERVVRVTIQVEDE